MSMTTNPVHTPNTFSPFPQNNRLNLQLLMWLRVLAIIGQSAAVMYSAKVLHIQLPITTLFVWIGIYALLTSLTFLRLRSPKQVGPLEFFSQLLIDIVILSILLAYSGGGANPFVSLYLIPITISAITLPARSTWLLTTIAIGLYSWIMWFISPIESHSYHAEHFSMHTTGMWLGFIIGALLVSYFVVRMGNIIRQQQKILMEQRTAAIQNEQVVRLGALAANTAHELGTPLGTMQLVIDELQNRTDLDRSNTQASLELLNKQIARCKKALSVLSTNAGQPQALSGEKMYAATFMHQLLQDWQQSRPDAKLQTEWRKPGQGPMLIADTTLHQAIRNILNNAADVSPQHVRCMIDWQQNTLEITIEDHGPGIPVQQAGALGKMPVTSASDGLGIGLFLSHRIIQAFGGQIRLANLDSHGLQTLILLPISD